MVDLVQTEFREGRLAEESMWQAVVMIPKGVKDYCGIGLVEVMWKVVAEILNLRLTASITFHDFHHWILDRSRNRYRHPQGQDDSSASGLEVGGPVCDIPGPTQGV